MKEVFILLGSNRGDRDEFLARALDKIGAMAGKILKRSSVYETDPWGFSDPTPFLNQAIEIETQLEPPALMEQLLAIEAQLGRIRPFEGCGCGIPKFPEKGEGHGGESIAAYAGRTIDLDILFYGNRMVFTEALMIPHPRLHERNFTLAPLNEIAPGFVHPLLKKTISLLLRDCPDRTNVTVVRKAGT